MQHLTLSTLYHFCATLCAYNIFSFLINRRWKREEKRLLWKLGKTYWCGAMIMWSSGWSLWGWRTLPPIFVSLEFTAGSSLWTAISTTTNSPWLYRSQWPALRSVSVYTTAVHSQYLCSGEVLVIYFGEVYKSCQINSWCFVMANFQNIRVCECMCVWEREREGAGGTVMLTTTNSHWLYR